jgi:hypothetical protein
MWILLEKSRSWFWAADLRFVLGAGWALDAWMDVTWGGVSGRACGASGSIAKISETRTANVAESAALYPDLSEMGS